MTQEEKDLLLIDLCARLPYGIKADDGHGVLNLNPDTNMSVVITCGVRPYLRPMSSMTEEELKEFTDFTSISMHRFICNTTNTDHWYNTYEEEDWLNAHHFDYRGLIEKGLALEAPEEMYNTKTE